MSKINKELFRGHVDTIILKTMQEESSYGYDMLNNIQTKTNSIYEIKQSTLYNILNRLEAEGFISSFYGDESKGGKRKYYKLTEKGHKKLEKDQNDWVFSRTLLDNLVSSKKIELTEETATFNPSELRPLTRRKQPIEAKTEDDIDDTESAYDDTNKVSNSAESTNDVEVNIKVEKAANKLQLGNHRYDGNISHRPSKLEAITINSPTMTFDTNNKNLKLDKHPTPKNYKTILGDLFKEEHNKKDITSYNNIETLDKDLQKQHFNDLKHTLSLDGFKLKIYNKASNTQHYYMKYIYANKIKRDAFLISSLIYVFMFIFLSIFYKQVGFKSISLPIISMSVFALFPIYPILLHNINRHKKIKNNFNLTLSLIRNFIFLAITFAILTIVEIGKGTLTTQMKNIIFYLPLIYVFYVNLYFAAYYLLLKNKKYYVSIK